MTQTRFFHHPVAPQSAFAPIALGPVPGSLRLPRFVVSSSDVAVFVETTRPEILFERNQVLHRCRRVRWTLGPAYSLPELARGGPEVDLHTPDPVLAWIQFPDRILEIEAHVIAFTERAVLVEWGFSQAAECAWVWRDAVQPRP